MNQPYAARNGFSLVELSIVLVILGLLAGGVMTGQSLIRAAELRSVSTEFQRYQAAVMTFRDKYMSLPGDMRGATKFWGFQGGGAAPSCVSNFGIATTSDRGVCDGNGDGTLASAAAASAAGEIFQAWRHLAAAGLIEGSYSGTSGASEVFDHDHGINSPTSRISNAGWGLSYYNNIFAALPYIFLVDYRNNLTIGTSSIAWSDGGFLKPDEAWNIDVKTDDGKPARGNIHSRVDCTDTTSNSAFNADYNLSNSAKVCALFFRYLN